MTTLAQTAAGRAQIGQLLGLCPGQLFGPGDVTNTVFNWVRRCSRRW